MNATGGCLCGAVRFTAHLPSKWVAHCHCTRCQRSGGAAFQTWVGVDDDACTPSDPQGRLTWYVGPTGGERGFCAACGTSLFFRSPRWPGELHVTLPSFDGPVDRAPQAHVFWDTHVDWVAFDPADGLPRKTAAETG